MTVGRQAGARVLLAVNGTLMRGLELNGNLLAVDGRYVQDAATDASYRMWSIDDKYPAMLRVSSGGAALSVEVWSLPADAIATVLEQEPDGLTIGKVRLSNGSVLLGVLGEAAACERQREITAFGGWRQYVASLAGTPPAPAAGTASP